MALSPYEVAVNKAKAENQNKLGIIQQKQSKKDPLMADVEKRLESIRRDSQGPTTQKPTDLSLITCKNCSHSVSKRADKCPKCGHALSAVCSICNESIPKTSTACPECGDPAPFSTNLLHKEATEEAILREPKPDLHVKSAEVSQDIRKQPVASPEVQRLSPSEILFSFKGRITRKQFWIYLTPLLFIALIMLFLNELFRQKSSDVMWYESSNYSQVFTILLLCAIPLCWASLAVTIKRLHDRNKSFWWILLFQVPIIGSIWALIELGFLRGTVGSNKYGEDPLSSEVLVEKSRFQIQSD